MVVMPLSEIKQYGNSYYFRVPKKLIDCKILEVGEKYHLDITKA